MTNSARTLLLTTALVAAAGSALAARQNDVPSSILENPLRMAVIADGAQAFMGTVEFKLTNTSAEILRVPSWQLPNGTIDSDVFEIYRGGKRVEYTGPMIKRAAPTDADYVTLQPGETKRVRVDLGSAYDLSQGGSYDVKFKTYLQGARTQRGQSIAKRNGQMATLESAPLRLYVDSRSPLRSLKPSGGTTKAKPGSGRTVVNGVN